MNYRIFIKIVLVLSIGITISKTFAGNDKVKKLTEEEKIKLSYTFVDASRAKITNNLEEALKKYNECLTIDPANDAAMYEIAQIYVAKNKITEAIPYAKKAVELNPKNEWYLVLLGDIYKKNNQLNEVINAYKQLIKNYPQNTEYYFQIATIYTLAKKPNDALKTYDKIEQMTGLNPDVSAERERIYIAQNKVDKAINEVQKLITAFPNEPKYYGILAELYQANKQDDKALEMFNKILELDRNNSFVHLSLADHYRTNGDKEKSFNELKLAFANKYLDMETKLRIIASYALVTTSNPEMYKQAIELCKLLIEAHPTDSRAFTVFGEFLSQDQKYKEARDNYRIAITFEKKTFAVWAELLDTDFKLSDYESLLKDSDEGISLFPTQPLVYFCNGAAKSQSDKLQEAIDAYKTGLNLVVDDKRMEEQFYSNLGDAYFKIKNYKLSDESYEKALEIKPKDNYVLNNYAYYLSLRGEKLERAAAMSRLSNEIEPNSASYEDTYGWILYKQEKYADAKTWVLKAMDHGGTKNAVILEHLGDINFKLGDIQGAIEFWEKAKKGEGKPSEFLDKKLADKKLYE